IGCYDTVRSVPIEVASELDALAAAYARGGRAHYFRVRDECFNPLRDRLRQADGRITYTPELAAMLIYLNRTGFNGLLRVNKRGAAAPVTSASRPPVRSPRSTGATLPHAAPGCAPSAFPRGAPSTATPPAAVPSRNS